jgi:hypothetical protein
MLMAHCFQLIETQGRICQMSAQSTAPISPDEKKDGISFQEYLDLFYDLLEEESLSDDEFERKLNQILNDRGIPEDRQTQLAGEFIQALHNPQPKPGQQV